MKRYSLYFLLMYLLFPMVVYAIPEYVIPLGNNIGIELKSDNVIVVGAYNIGSYNVLEASDLKIGDKILKINDYDVSSISMIEELINKLDMDKVLVTYKRDNNIYKTYINLYKEDGVYKTGLYVRETIRGVATLTYVDPLNNSFGALGHEILEKTTKSRFQMDSGKIFYSTVTGITKSYDGIPGEKNAYSDSSNVYGYVFKNTKSGIFGNYIKEIPPLKKYHVVGSNEIKLGDAKILTVIDGDRVEEFEINILKINQNSKTKNILFEVTDKKLLDMAGGIVQGMSGSPIIQGNNIIGAVNFVVVDKTNRGYGIFITTMLEEAEKN